VVQDPPAKATGPREGKTNGWGSGWDERGFGGFDPVAPSVPASSSLAAAAVAAEMQADDGWGEADGWADEEDGLSERGGNPVSAAAAS
jgi:predicted cobalt transporter CbtA